MKNIILKTCSIVIAIILVFLSSFSIGLQTQIKNIPEEESVVTQIVIINSDEVLIEPETIIAEIEIEETTRRQMVKQPLINEIDMDLVPIPTTVLYEEPVVYVPPEPSYEIPSATPPIEEGEYEAATTIWNYLKSLGYNDYVCAGIMGNIMSEVGGHTLNIQYWMKDNGYYGICQWSYEYCPGVWGASLSEQLNYLACTIEEEFRVFGYKYSSGFDYESFLSLTDVGAAALAFAKCYERCADWTYNSRINNAYKAYDYFT